MPDYQSPPVGNDIGCVFHGVKDEIINNHAFLKDCLKKALKEDKFSILAECEHEFNPKGYTLMFLLSESHATIHTYPEYKSFAMHIYTCLGPEDGRIATEHFKNLIQAERVETFERPIVVDPTIT